MNFKMNFFLIFFVGIWTGIAGHDRRLPDEYLANEIYEAAVNRKYEVAVSKALKLETESRGNVIGNAVQKLIDNGKPNVFAFAYKLMKDNTGHDIVENRFPTEIKQIMFQNLVKIITIRDNQALKLGSAKDNLGDRIAYGAGSDKTSENIAWKFIPVYQEKQLYFKIYHINRRQYLKLGVDIDGEKDHAVFGDDHADTRRHQWYLKPVKHGGKLLFYVYNRQYQQGLKLSRTADSVGDRRAYSNHGEVSGQPRLFAWNIVSFY